MPDNPEDAEDFSAINTSGWLFFSLFYLSDANAADKTVDEYQNLDSNDESLARWKASLGIGVESSDLRVSMISLRSHFLSIFP